MSQTPLAPTLRVRVSPGALQSQHNAELAGLVQGCFASRLFASDLHLFGDAEARRKVVAQRLGWLSSARWMKDHVGELLAFADEVKRDGLVHVLLLGMGGSSLCPEVLAAVFGRPPHLATFDIVDATDPRTLARLEATVDLKRTLFLVASKSGSTVETQSQAMYFLEKLKSVSDHAGRRFVAITDAGSALEKFATAESFRRIFLNPEDIGGRYSALSYFGMVPAALLGLPLSALAGEVEALTRLLASDNESNPALAIGALLGAAARSGADKLTFAATPALAAVVPWIEQLVAESTGKQGRGVIPIEAEPEGDIDLYGPDRVFCMMRMTTDPAPVGTNYAALPGSGRPHFEIECADRTTLAALFLLWECATAASGRVLDINPFDEPNVKESKDNTLRLLTGLAKDGRFQEPAAVVTTPTFELATETLAGHDTDCLLASLLQGTADGDYLSFLYFGDRTSEAEIQLQMLRSATRAATGVATLRGYGPRYLHSIGQLYKGGPQKGHFVVFATDSSTDRSIPGAAFSFGQLLRAQAIGDYQALSGRNRPCLLVRLSGEPAAGLKAFAAAWERACAQIAV